MLIVRTLPRRNSIHSWIESTDFEKTTWIVPDLRSKFEIQQVALERNGYFLDESVLRASDFWKLQLRRVRPEIRLVSTDFAKSMVRGFLRDHQELRIDGRSPSENLVMAAMNRFAGMIFHPEGETTLQEWFAANPQASERWKVAFLLARAAFGLFSRENTLIAPWIAPFLLNVDEPLSWPKEINVDLGGELTGAEAQLIRELSKTSLITVFEPLPEWRRDYPQLLKPYDEIRGFAQKIENATDDELSSSRSHRELQRLPSQLAEVKQTVSCVRSWLESGVEATKVAVFAADIEKYWPTLHAYFQEEGIPVDKGLMVKLSARPSIGRWMARLRPRPAGAEITAQDLETAYYGSARGDFLDVAEFRRLFTNIYGPEDLKRHERVERFMTEGPKFEDRMSRDMFMLAAARFWESRDETDSLILVAREVLQNATVERELPLTDWVAYLEAVVARKETPFEPGQAGGVQISSLQGARTRKVTHRIFLGLCEEDLKRVDRQALPAHDVVKLSDLGFHVDHPDQSLLEFETRWLALSPSEQSIFMVGLTDFEGSVLSPSPVWIRWRREDHPDEHEPGIELPGLTRWETLMNAAPISWGETRGWSQSELSAREHRIALDLGKVEAGPSAKKLPEKLSPSLLKNYRDCPFKGAVSVLFGQSDKGELDLDPAHSDQGSLVHALFQRLCEDTWRDRLEASDAELGQLLDEIRAETGFMMADERLWAPYQRKQIRIAREFLRVEADWRARYPRLKEISSEVPWKIFFDPQTGSFSHEESTGSIRISGRIDRLESDGQGRFVVVDYKKSASRLESQADWLDENDLQLLFYLWALERGAVEGRSGRVIGAFYYVYRDFTRTLGLQIENDGDLLFPADGTKKAMANEERKAELLESLEVIVRETVQKMGEGVWAPHPRDVALCEYCSWSDVCRAPHLN